jgi:GDSL-like Lipase/Acylhydrolase family
MKRDVLWSFAALIALGATSCLPNAILPSDEPMPRDSGSGVLDRVAADTDANKTDQGVSIDVAVVRDTVLVDRMDANVVPDVSPVTDVMADVFVMDALPDGSVLADVDASVDSALPDIPSLSLPLNVDDMVPPFDMETEAHIREVRAVGVMRGMRPNVFSKLGDSITESASFFRDIGRGWHDLVGYTSLAPTVSFFRAYRFPDGNNSFDRPGLCAMGNWLVGAPLSGSPESFLSQEFRSAMPAYALVLFGTNDVDRSTVAAFRTNLTALVDAIEANGTVAIMSTIPDRNDRPTALANVMAFNQVIRDIAGARHAPYIDLWRTLLALPDHGIGPDGIHPSIYLRRGDPQSAVFSAEGLQYGYNVRNLISLVALDKVRAVR